MSQMETVIDWTPRKRSLPEALHAAPPVAAQRDDRDDAAVAEQPFAFVAAAKKRSRCRLACCTTFSVPSGVEQDPSQEVRSIIKP
jgi:hypothetical protein